MKRASLAILVRVIGTVRYVHFGIKTTEGAEIGDGTYNGPGGKKKRGETMAQCLKRESFEEIRIIPTEYEEVAILLFYNAGVLRFQVHVYLVTAWEGETKQTKDMQPAWHKEHEIPYQKMLAADEHWLPKILAGERFNATIRYTDAHGKIFERITFRPYRPRLNRRS